MSRSFVENWKKSIVEEFGYNTPDMRPFLEAIKDNNIFIDWLLTVPAEFIPDEEIGLGLFLDTLECANHETIDNSDFSLIYFYLVNGIDIFNELDRDVWLSYSIEQGEFGKIKISLFFTEKESKYLIKIADFVFRESEHIGFFDFDDEWEPTIDLEELSDEEFDDEEIEDEL